MSVSKILVLSLMLAFVQVVRAEGPPLKTDVTVLTNCLLGLGHLPTPNSPNSTSFSFDAQDAQGHYIGLYEITPAGARTVTWDQNAEPVQSRQPAPDSSQWSMRYFDEEKQQIVFSAAGVRDQNNVFQRVDVTRPAKVTDTSWSNVCAKIGAVIKSDQVNNSMANGFIRNPVLAREAMMSDVFPGKLSFEKVRANEDLALTQMLNLKACDHVPVPAFHEAAALRLKVLQNYNSGLEGLEHEAFKTLTDVKDDVKGKRKLLGMPEDPVVR